MNNSWKLMGIISLRSVGLRQISCSPTQWIKDCGNLSNSDYITSSSTIMKSLQYSAFSYAALQPFATCRVPYFAKVLT